MEQESTTPETTTTESTAQEVVLTFSDASKDVEIYDKESKLDLRVARTKFPKGKVGEIDYITYRQMVAKFHIERLRNEYNSQVEEFKDLQEKKLRITSTPSPEDLLKEQAEKARVAYEKAQENLKKYRETAQ